MAPDNTQKCQIWGFFLLSVPWFGLCYFLPQSTLVVLEAQTIEEKNGGLGEGVQEDQRLPRVRTELGSPGGLP